jgi:outer membrane protein
MLAALGVCLFTVLPAAADVKIATVDMGRLLNESPEASAKKKELDALTQDAKKKAAAKRKEIESLKEKLEDSETAADSKEAEALRARARDYTRYVKDTEEDIKKQYLKVNRDITQKVMARVEAYAKKNDIDLILDKSDKYRGPVLFGDTANDITDEILDD